MGSVCRIRGTQALGRGGSRTRGDSTVLHVGAYDGRPDSVGVKVGDVTGLGVRLSWQQALLATSYAVYRGATAFFRPNETHLLVEGWTALFLIDPGAWGSARVNR